MLGGIIGRERELATAALFLDHLDGGCAGLVFAGGAGIGKTTLWSAAVAQARERGLCALSTRVIESEAKLGFAALGDLLEPVVDDLLAELPEPQRQALAVALLREDAGERALDQRVVGAATLTIVRLLAQRGQVLLAIDDLQWLDRPTARALEFALRRLNDAPVGVVGCERAGSVATVPIELERLLPETRVTRVDVEPLTLAALHEIFKARLGRSLSRRTLVRIEQASCGNPLFALEIARALPDDASASSPLLPLPDNLLQLVELRMSKLPRAVRRCLLAAAALPSPTVELVAAAVEQTPKQALAALDRATAAGVVRLDGLAPRFSHPLYAAAVYASAAPAERRRVHARLAGVVDEIEERARHLALAAETADETTAAALDAAAEHARRRGAPDTAAVLAEQARLLTPPGQAEQVLRRTIKAAEYQFHAGELRLAREALEAVRTDAADGALRAEALRLLGEICFHERSFPEAVSLFEEALELAGGDAALQAAVEVQLAYCTCAAADFAGARIHAYRALELAERPGRKAGLAEVLAASAMAEYLMGGGLDERRLRRALHLEDPERQVAIEMRPSLIAGFLMLYEGRLAESIRILGGLRERLLERGQDGDLPFVLAYLVWGEAWRGDLAAAAAYADEALEFAAGTGGEPLRCLALAFAAIAPAYAGDSELTNARADECEQLAARVGMHIAYQWAGWARAVLALAAGDAETAERALARLLPALEERGVAEPILGFFLPDAIEAMIATGQLERAERLLALFEASARRLRRGWAMMAAGRCRALLLSAQGDLEPAAQAAREAVAVGEPLELRLEFARTLLVAGRIERRRRQKRAARELLERGLAIFEGSGAHLWAERTRHELERVGLRSRPHSELTATEQRIAELAADGFTNIEIAAAVFVSPKTVEANLARVYQKLDVHSRAQLARRLPGQEATRRQT